ncbi:hypothetical protein I7I51_07910 [Histoplasma capsulatum]|uniref:Uncharacterized protein n=1 Tax=Ajellomyces capsulatus TaxID=5037 RepID=A0A8A1M1E1_AJECA|nr:hypothetical protein I7I51_07910 [Histoplasma capsulatum]
MEVVGDDEGGACPALARLRVGGPSQDWRANRPAWVPSHRWALEMHLYTGTGADSPSQTVDVARRPEKGFFLAQEKGFPVDYSFALSSDLASLHELEFSESLGTTAQVNLPLRF